MVIWHPFHRFRDSASSRRERRARRTRRGRNSAPVWRETKTERLEERSLLTTGPQLISIIPDNGGVLLPGETLNSAPTQLTFRFDQNQVINPTTLTGGIELVRSGGDGVFGNSNDVTIFPGYLGIGTTPNEVVMRFSTPLPADLYDVTIVGSGPDALENAAGQAFNGGVNYNLDFRLNLAPQVVGVVPQPISPANSSGVRTQVNNEVDVYFNEPLDATSVSNPALYQLIRTKNTSTTADDIADVPTSAVYVAANDEVRLFFNSDNVVSSPAGYTPIGSITTLAQFATKDGMPNESLRLRIGNSDQPQAAPTIVQVPASPNDPSTPNGTGPGDTYTSSMNAGTLANGQTNIYNSAITPLPVNPGLAPSGGDNVPGVQNLPNPITASSLQLASGALSSLAAWVQSEGINNHIIDGNANSQGGVVTIAYNFQDIYGTDPNGNLLHNAIIGNPTQEQLVREIFGLFSYYTGANFVQTADSGITIAVGDVRAVSPTAPPTNINGAEGPTKTSNGAPVVVVNGNVNWGQNEYGGNFFRVAMDEIGKALGLGNNYDQPGSIEGTAGFENATQSAPTADTSQVFPGNPDVNNLQFLYATDSSDVNIYKLTVTQSGTLNAQTLAQRLTPTSNLDTLLSLYNEVTLLGVPVAGGQATSPSPANQGLEGQTFAISATAPAGQTVTRTFEFNSGYSLDLPVNTSVAGLDGQTFSLTEGAKTVTFEFAADGRAVTDGNTAIDFNSTDLVSTVAGDIVQTINYAVKNLGLSGGQPPISATYSGIDPTGTYAVVNIGGDVNTTFNPQTSPLTLSGSVTLTTPGAVMVRYAPADNQHQLAEDIAAAVNSPVLDVLNTPVSGTDQFTVDNGTVSKTFELDTSGVSTSPGVIPIQFSATDTPQKVAQEIAIAVNAAFGAGSATANSTAPQVVFNFVNGSVTASATAKDVGVLNVAATAELTQVQLQGSLTLNLKNVPEFSSSIQHNLISRNDNYFGTDSNINLELQPGVYYVAVSASGNSQFDPNVHGSGWGGRTDGM